MARKNTKKSPPAEPSPRETVEPRRSGGWVDGELVQELPTGMPDSGDRVKKADPPSEQEKPEPSAAGNDTASKAPDQVTD